MKILHTSDWHLGASFNERKRYNEHEQTLNWLIDTIKEKNVTAVIIAGDVFDSSLPSNKAQELYYNFLCDASAVGVKNIIVTAGNHDSPSFLDAPKALLKRLNVSVSGKPSEQIDDGIIPLKENDTIKAVVCAIPYLRAGDIRNHESGESSEETANKHRGGIIEHYNKVINRAKELYPGTKIIATGHLFATGGEVSSGRISGTLSDVAIENLPKEISYFALGHLHLPQRVGGRENCRYCGSLLNMNFSSKETKRQVLVLDSEHLEEKPEVVEIPVFQEIRVVSGTLDEIKANLEQLKADNKSYWIKVVNTGYFEPNLRTLLAKICDESLLDVISYENSSRNPEIIKHLPEERIKFEFTPENVFSDLLNNSGMEAVKTEQLKQLFHAIVAEMNETDTNKE